MSALAATVEELRNDRQHGASWMARRAVEALLEVSKEPVENTDSLVDGLVEAGRELAESRPGVGAIAGAAGRVLAAANAHRYLELDDLRRLIGE
jgi:translation initiation factor 2B subunit (eIF-2B alpha/beta/delta family)